MAQVSRFRVVFIARPILCARPTRSLFRSPLKSAALDWQCRSAHSHGEQVRYPETNGGEAVEAIELTAALIPAMNMKENALPCPAAAAAEPIALEDSLNISAKIRPRVPPGAITAGARPGDGGEHKNRSDCLVRKAAVSAAYRVIYLMGETCATLVNPGSIRNSYLPVRRLPGGRR